MNFSARRVLKHNSGALNFNHMSRYFNNYSSIPSPSLSAGLFTDPQSLHVDARDLSDAGSYGIAGPVANNRYDQGPGWSPNGQTWSNDYQFDDSVGGALQRAGVSAADAQAFQSQQAMRAAAMASQQRAMMQSGGRQPGQSAPALTASLADNRILGGIQDPQALGLMLQRRTDAQMKHQVGYGIVGNNVSIDGQNIPIPVGADPDVFATQQQSRVNTARAAALGNRSRFDVFRSQPEIRDLGVPAAQALYESRYGEKENASKTIDNINRQLDAYTKAFGVNPIAAVNHMEATGAKEGFVISMPGKFDKGASGDANGTYVPGPNVHLTPGLIEIGRKMRQAQADAVGIHGDLTSQQFPFGYDPTIPSTDKNQIVQPRVLAQTATPPPVLRSAPAAAAGLLIRPAATPAPSATPSASQEVKVFNGKRYLVDHATRAVTPLDQ